MATVTFRLGRNYLSCLCLSSSHLFIFILVSLFLSPLCFLAQQKGKLQGIYVLIGCFTGSSALQRLAHNADNKWICVYKSTDNDEGLFFHSVISLSLSESGPSKISSQLQQHTCKKQHFFLVTYYAHIMNVSPRPTLETNI